MARYHQKQRRTHKSINKTTIAVVAGLFLWMALLLSPLGSVVAVVTILGLIVIFFIIGCINVREDDFRK